MNLDLDLDLDLSPLGGDLSRRLNQGGWAVLLLYFFWPGGAYTEARKMRDDDA